ncbi:MAG: hypothetical protein U1C71_04525, partial [archaeon]|nr:hypothetical protein [archaeon]
MTLIKCGGAACNPLFNSNPIIFGNYVRGHASLISPTTGLPLIFYQMRPAQPPYSLQLRVARCQDPACTTRSESILDDNTTIYRIGADN